MKLGNKSENESGNESGNDNRAVHFGADSQGKREYLNCTLSLLRLQPAAHKHCSWSPHKLRSVNKRNKASSKINALQTQLCFKVRLIKNKA